MATTTTDLSSSQNPSTFGQSVTFTATVTGASPGGTVNFLADKATIGACGAQPLSGATATCTTSSLGLGGHSIIAVYSGDTNNVASGSPILTQTVYQASTTALDSSQNPSTFGQSVTFTATVTGASPGGTVNFKDGSASIAACGAQPLSGATATCTTSSLGLGGHGVTAVYSGDTNNATSTSPVLAQTVNQASTTTGLGSSQNPSTFGQSVTFTATVSGMSAGGTVNFKDGSTTIGSCGAQPLTGATATCTTSSLGGGGHSITAVYSGDTNNLASTSPVVTQTVNQASTSTALSSAQNPSTVGQPVTFTATVTGLSAGGTVTFKDGSTTVGWCGAQPVSGATATCTTSSLGVGSHGITAVYSGDANNAASTSGPLVQSVVAPAPSTPPATSTGGQGASPTVTNTVAPASKQFTLSQVVARADGSVSFSLTLPGAGAIDVLETASNSSAAARASLPKPERGRFAFASKHLAATGAATMTVRVTPNARGKRAIARNRRAHRALFINLWVTYTPNGGDRTPFVGPPRVRVGGYGSRQR
jgi:hypothetical protein